LPLDAESNLQANSVFNDIPRLGMTDGNVGSNPVVPSPPKTNQPARLKRGGDVEEALLLSQTKPAYPLLAIQTRTQGDVVLRAIIGKDGSVAELQVVSGHPLLVKAAMDAVRQWRYKPTLLNGEPVEVDTTITVSFRLGG
jgi:protein TonB